MKPTAAPTGLLIPLLQFFHVLGGQPGAVTADITLQALQQERDFGVGPAAEHAVVLSFLRHYFSLLRRISSTIP
jgi:hypothetical protein